MKENIFVGILTVSDRCSKGLQEDKSGPKVLEVISNLKGYNVVIQGSKIVPDEMEIIQTTLKRWCDDDKMNLILTTGGTGFSSRDITPEATRLVIEKEAPGLQIGMFSTGLQSTPFSMLSRAVCGIRKSSLIINLPGSVKGAKESLEAILTVLPHAISLLNDNGKSVDHYKTSPSEDPSQCGCYQQEDPENDLKKLNLSENDKIARRHRQSPFPMTSMDKAVEIVLQHSNLCATEIKSFSESFGYILAEDIISKENIPPFRASIMDGYALTASNTPGQFDVIGRSVCGDETANNNKLSDKKAVRINTGAPVPDSADTVVPVENTKLVEEGDEGAVELRIEVMKKFVNGQHIRPLGCDVMKGQQLFRIGNLLSAADIGILASVGHTNVKVRRRPVVAVFSTGDELIDATSENKTGAIRDANRITLILTFKQHGFETHDLGIVADDRDQLHKKFLEACDKADVIVTSGGVSMGEKDYMKSILVQLGAKIQFGRVFMKPGKPTTFATLKQSDPSTTTKSFFALPGNPVSSIVTCNLFVLPALKKMSGYEQPKATIIKAKLGFDVNLDPRPEYQRVRLEWKNSESLPLALSTGKQISSRLLSMNTANALIIIPPKTDCLTKLHRGDTVDSMLIDQP